MPDYDAHILSWFLTWLIELVIALFFFHISARLVFTVIILNSITQPVVYAVTGVMFKKFLFQPVVYFMLWAGIEFVVVIVEMFGWRIFFQTGYRKSFVTSLTTNMFTAMMSFLL